MLATNTERVSDLADQLKAALVERDDLHRSLVAREEAAKKMASEVDALHEALRLKEQHAVRAQNLMIDSERSLREAQSKLQNVESQLQREVDNCSRLTARISDLERHAEVRSTEASLQEKERDRVCQAIHASDRISAEMLERVQRRLGALDDRIVCLEKVAVPSVSRALAALSAAKNACLEGTHREAALRIARDALQRQVDALGAEANSLRVSIAQLKEAGSQANVAYETLHAKHSHLLSQLDSKSALLETETSRLAADSQSALERLRAESETRQRQLELQALADKSTLESALLVAQTRAAQDEEEVRTLQTRIDELSQALLQSATELRKEREEAAARSAALESTSATLRAHVEDTRCALLKETARADMLQQKLTEVEAAAARASAPLSPKLTHSLDQVQQLEAQVTSLVNALGSKDGIILALRGSNDEVTRRCHFLEDSVTELQSEKVVLDQHLQGLKVR